jgi:hypothetical protein
MFLSKEKLLCNYGRKLVGKNKNVALMAFNLVEDNVSVRVRMKITNLLRKQQI